MPLLDTLNKWNVPTYSRGNPATKNSFGKVHIKEFDIHMIGTNVVKDPTERNQ